MQNRITTNHSNWTILKLLEWATSYFKSREVESPRASAEILLAHALHVNRIDLYLRYDQPLCSSELERFKVLIKRRTQREPVAYILGTKEFWSMEFAVTPDVLIPRPETESLVEAALGTLGNDHNTAPRCILELGTGCGAIALALASRQPQHLFFASDVSEAAVRIAKQNAKRHDLDRRIHLFVGDWVLPLRKNARLFDLIISNPPYIPKGGIPELQPEISKYEPHLALNGEEDGLSCLKKIILASHRLLKPRGSLILEIGHDQKAAVRRVIERCGRYDEVIFSKDYSGMDRIARMRKKNVAN
jgi:release factor glutamine methyltransferase